MTHVIGKGNYIDGQFVKGRDQIITSANPARNYEMVFETATSTDQVNAAVDAARIALPSWSSLTQDDRVNAMMRVKDAFVRRQQDIAKAITLEMGKVFSESLTEAKSLSARIDLTAHHALKRVATEYPDGVSGEARYHAQGVLAVLGPYNFPAHLVNSHVIPALMTGNTVVVKPSEICPWTGELYAECMHDAKLPPGVFNMVQGRGDVGKTLAKHPLIRGILFTGSYQTGRILAEAVLDEPHKILALEMGGKNIAVVLQDADLYQALVEITQGAFLTTGQRCTATSRVLVDRRVADRLIESLARVTQGLRPDDPMDSKTVFGPLATRDALDKFTSLLQNASKANCDVLAPSNVLGGGAFVTPSLHLLKKKAAPGYIDTELFGPDVCVEIIEDLDEAIARTNESAYGLSNSIFTANQSSFERYYRETYSGVLNWNRSTNGASGHLPFGGVGKSGNQRPAGIDAVRYTTFPVAINHHHYGDTDPVATLLPLLRQEEPELQISLPQLVSRHELEALLERYHIPVDDAKGQSIFLSLNYLHKLSFNGRSLDSAFLVDHFKPFATIDDKCLVLSLPNQAGTEVFFRHVEAFFETLCDQNYDYFAAIVPPDVHVPNSDRLPRSEAMLHRLYRDNFIPAEKKSPVINLYTSKGPYLSSIDEDPLVIFDAASQIASNGVGFSSGIFLRALDDGDLASTLAANVDLAAPGLSQSHPEIVKIMREYSDIFLNHTWRGLSHVAFTSSGAEANEKAFDLCRLNGPGGRRIIAFEGSFHGRTLMALQATYNPQKRGAFEFAGYEATFIPFPTWQEPSSEPEVEDEWIASWSKGEAPLHLSNDPLLAQEIASLKRVKEEIEKGDVCAVIIEPMQCEGGDKYATAQFFNGLRALTRALKVPLIFDEVQTGFGLLGPFFFHSHFQLRNVNGEVDGPDCVTMAKKAQLGVCLSAWPDPRPLSAHVVQMQRGLLQARSILHASPEKLELDVQSRLLALQQQFPDLVFHPRQKGYAFAFDLPNNHIATQAVNQRFYRGFMVYIAGDKTLRFRLNLATTTGELDTLFSGIAEALSAIDENGMDSYVAPAWVAPKNKRRRAKTTQSSLGPISIEVLKPEDWTRYESQIEALEHAAYEPSRRDSMPYLRDWIETEGSLGLMLIIPTEEGKRILGYAFGGPLEHSDVDGPEQDAMRGKYNTFYSANVVIHQEAQGLGFGLKLKKAQVEHIRAMRRADGSLRYHYMTGRNRVGFTQQIRRINRALGAYTVHVYDRQYGETDGKALYYRIPLRRPRVDWINHGTRPVKHDWSSSIEAPLGSHPQEIIDDIEKGVFTTAVGTKLTLSNWVTPDVVRYAELLKRLMPKACRHAYFTSGRDEIVDKGLRCLRVHRPKADIVIGLEKQYVGHTTAAARSLSDPAGQQQPFSWFDWPRISHPNDVGVHESIEQIRRAIERFSPERILGIAVELIGEKSGYVVNEEFLAALEQLRNQSGIPLIYIETASSLGRNGQALFMSDALRVQPNMVWWYTGGQLGHVLVDELHYVAKPLTLISTWDGDEISMRRTYRHLLVANNMLHQGRGRKFGQMFAEIGIPTLRHGQGLWQILDVQDQTKRTRIIEHALQNGLRMQLGLENRIVICPPLNVSDDQMYEGLDLLKQAFLS